MNNTVITLISALVFLIIGLFIGKSNKQIEIQTVVKTNIIEKPIIEYVDKYVTNVVEKLVETEIPEGYKNSLKFVNKILNAEILNTTNSVKTPYFDSLGVSAYVSPPLRELISSDDIKEKLELELRKAGIRIDDKPTTFLTATLEGFELDNKLQYVYKYSLEIETWVYIYDYKNDIAYRHIAPILIESNFGMAGKQIINKTYLNNKFSEASDKIINKLLESKEKHEIKK